jgi:hypothetical protein
MNFVHRNIVQNFPELKVYQFLGWPPGMSAQGSKKYLEENVKTTTGGLLVAHDTVVFIDDAQSSYYDHQLWSLFKLLETGSACFIDHFP